MEDSKNKNFEGTMVDMGEDLIEQTRSGAVINSSPKNSASSLADTPFNLQEEVQKGEILYNEKLFDDAKKVLRKVLRHSPRNPTATRILEEIQKQELQDLLGGEAPRKRLGQTDAVEDQPAAVLERLEKELNVHFDRGELKPVPDLFESQEAFDRYKRKISAAVEGLPAQNQIDLGIAHLEMGLFETSQKIFEEVVRSDEHKLPGMYLLGLALIFGGKAIEATIKLEPLCRDLSLSEGAKTDFLYLMGLAFERLNDVRKAREFYRRAYTLNPKYRDVLDKLK